MVANFSRDSLRIDCKREADRVAVFIRSALSKRLKRRGAVIGLSGGIDSSVVAGLCVHALGPKRVFGVLMPERDSSDETRRLSRMLVQHLGIEAVEEDITPILEAAGCYRRRDDGDPRGRSRIWPRLEEQDRAPERRRQRHVPHLLGGRSTTGRGAGEAPARHEGLSRRRGRDELQAAHAQDARVLPRRPAQLRGRRYAEPARVRSGLLREERRRRGGLQADRAPLQDPGVRDGRELGLPDEICDRAPTTDTYSLPQSQEEFYFSLPYQDMDVCLYARDHDVSAADCASALGLMPEQVERIYRDIEGKRAFASYLHAEPLTIDG